MDKMKNVYDDNNTIKLSKIELELLDKEESFELVTQGKRNFVYRYVPLDVMIPIQEFNGNYHILFNPNYEKAIKAIDKIKEITKYN